MMPREKHHVVHSAVVSLSSIAREKRRATKQFRPSNAELIFGPTTIPARFKLHQQQGGEHSLSPDTSSPIADQYDEANIGNSLRLFRPPPADLMVVDNSESARKILRSPLDVDVRPHVREWYIERNVYSPPRPQTTTRLKQFVVAAPVNVSGLLLGDAFGKTKAETAAEAELTSNAEYATFSASLTDELASQAIAAEAAKTKQQQSQHEHEITAATRRRPRSGIMKAKEGDEIASNDGTASATASTANNDDFYGQYYFGSCTPPQKPTP
jgi:hypothetical protein